MRSVFFISDQTGITTEKLGNALLGKFPVIKFRRESFPFVDTQAKINQALIKINNRYLSDGEKPIVVSSIINPELRQLLKVDYVLHIDFFEAFIDQLENEIGVKATLEINKRTVS